jgi:hypothetical protein
MPKIPPMAVKITDDTDKYPPPHNNGIIPPTVEPTNTPIQIALFEFIIKL